MSMTPSTNTSSLGLRGLQLGAQAGAALSWLYITGLMSIVFWFPLRELPRLDQIERLISILGVVIGYSLVIGMLPAVLVGAGTGWLLGRLIDRYFAVLSRDWAVVLGLSLCLLLALTCCMTYWVTLVGGPLFDPVSRVNVFGFWLLLGLPSVLYVPMGGWVADRLYVLRRRLG